MRRGAYWDWVLTQHITVYVETKRIRINAPVANRAGGSPTTPECISTLD